MGSQGEGRAVEILGRQVLRQHMPQALRDSGPQFPEIHCGHIAIFIYLVI